MWYSVVVLFDSTFCTPFLINAVVALYVLLYDVRFAQILFTIKSGSTLVGVWSNLDRNRQREGTEAGQEVSLARVGDQLDSMTRGSSVDPLCRFWSGRDGDGDRQRTGVETKLISDQGIQDGVQVSWPWPTLGPIQSLWLHRSSIAQLQSLITYSGHSHTDNLLLSMTLGLYSIPCYHTSPSALPWREFSVNSIYPIPCSIFTGPDLILPRPDLVLTSVVPCPPLGCLLVTVYTRP